MSHDRRVQMKTLGHMNIVVTIPQLFVVIGISCCQTFGHNHLNLRVQYETALVAISKHEDRTGLDFYLQVHTYIHT